MNASRIPLLLLAAAALAGCSILGGDKGRDPATIYSPSARVEADPGWPRAAWQLAIAPPEAARTVDTQRIVVKPVPGELQVYKGASWAVRPSEMLVEAVLRGLEDSGRIAGVARQGSGLQADYRLLTEIRRFEADYAGQPTPSAVVEVTAKLMREHDQRIVAARTFVQRQPAGSTDVGTVAAAFDDDLQRLAHDLIGWLLASGNADAAGKAE